MFCSLAPSIYQSMRQQPDRDDRRSCAGLIAPLTRRNAPVRRNSVILRFVPQMVIVAFLVTCYAERSHASRFPDEIVVYVGDRPYPGDFDPYYNQPKIYRQPRYYESTSKKTKGKRVFKTTKVKDQYGNTVYKKTTSHKKKKKK